MNTNECGSFAALVLLNLISLWVDSMNNQRIILLSLSLLGHFMYMQHLFWALPHNGDTLPDLCKKFPSIFYHLFKHCKKNQLPYHLYLFHQFHVIYALKYWLPDARLEFRRDNKMIVDIFSKVIDHKSKIKLIFSTHSIHFAANPLEYNACIGTIERLLIRERRFVTL